MTDTGNAHNDVTAYATTAELARAAAERTARILRAAIAARGGATWCIAGGTSPVATYQVLADQYLDALDWSKVIVIIGDERCVPFDSPDANWSQADELLLGRLTLSPQTRRPQSDQAPQAAAQQYESYLRHLPLNKQGLPHIDLLWLGVGPDGHTLSIFPDHSTLQQNLDNLQETDTAAAWLVFPVHNSPKPPAGRISLSFAALRAAVDCMVLVAGADKAAAVAKALAGDTSLPVARAAAEIAAAGGRVAWLADAAAVPAS